MKKIILGFFLLAGIAAVWIYFYAYKGHRDIASESADFTLSVAKLQQEHALDDSLFNKKYADKTLEISGKITNIDAVAHAIVIDEKVSAVFADSILPKMTLQQPIHIKGRFVGYDDLLEEFSVDQANLVK